MAVNPSPYTSPAAVLDCMRRLKAARKVSLDKFFVAGRAEDVFSCSWWGSEFKWYERAVHEQEPAAFAAWVQIQNGAGVEKESQP